MNIQELPKIYEIFQNQLDSGYNQNAVYVYKKFIEKTKKWDENKEAIKKKVDDYVDKRKKVIDRMRDDLVNANIIQPTQGSVGTFENITGNGETDTQDNKETDTSTETKDKTKDFYEKYINNSTTVTVGIIGLGLFLMYMANK